MRVQMSSMQAEHKQAQQQHMQTCTEMRKERAAMCLGESERVEPAAPSEGTLLDEHYFSLH
jgi:hypothetical protein